ncbi:MAG: S8 family serine peptidase [Trueperaceae bacterium]
MPPIPRGFAVLPLAMLILGLTACGAFQSPTLEVGPEQLQLDSNFPVKEIAISNAGGAYSVLRWSVSSDSPLIHFSPSRGEVRAGGSAEVIRVSVDFSSLEQGDVAAATVWIESNGGDAELQVGFLMDSTRACAANMEEPKSVEAGQLSASPIAGAFVPGEVLVGYRRPEGEFSGLSARLALEAQAGMVRADHELRLLSTSAAAGFERVATEDPPATAKRLAADPRVEFAHPNYYVRPLTLPNDPCYFDQWNIQGFGLPEAWEHSGLTSSDDGDPDSRGSSGSGSDVVVAIIDTGVDVDHEDLRNKTLQGIDLRDRDDDPRPGAPSHASAHGTHVAGIALAEGNNGVGVAGVAYGPRVRLLPVKIFDDSGMQATTADLADAMLWAAGISVHGLPRNPHPADIINMSVGAGSNRVPALERAAERARLAGALLLAAAGNNSSTNGQHGVQAPANAPAVIAVGSVDESLTRSSFSDWGEFAPTVDIMAPGGYGSASCLRVRSTVPWNNYGCMAGTSMAAPFAAGVAALILSREPGLDPQELTDRLLGTAYFDPTTMNSDEYGSGVLCADRAVSGSLGRRSLPCGAH